MNSFWEPDFDFYEARFENPSEDGVVRVAVFVDLAASKHAPVATHPVRFLVRVAMLHPRADGLRSEDEADALLAAEDTIVERVTAALDALYLGRVVAEGRATFAFYIPRARHAEAAEAANIVGNVAPYAPEWSCEEDVTWGYYREFLYPDDKSLAEVLSRRAADRILGVGQSS